MTTKELDSGAAVGAVNGTTKLPAIQDGIDVVLTPALINAPALARSAHTGTQPISSVALLQAALDGKATFASLFRSAGIEVGIPGGVDDTVAVTSARTSAGVGGTVIFGPGTYVVTGLAASVADQHWIIQPGAVIKTKNGADTPTIDVTANGVTIDGGGTIDGNRANQTNGNSVAGTTACVRIVSRSNVTVRGLLVKDGLSNGVLIDASSNVAIEHNRVQGCSAAGNQKQIAVYAAVGSSTDIRIADNRIDSTSPANGCIAITIAVAGRSAKRVHIVGNTCLVGDGSATPTLGIELFTSNAGGAGGAIIDSVVSGNIVLGPSTVVSTDLVYGISIGGTASDAAEGIDQVTLTGNIVRDCPASCIEVVGNGVTVTGNTLVRSGALSVNATSTVGGLVGVTVSGNSLVDSVSLSYAMLLEGGSNGLFGLVVQGNTIRNNGAGAAAISTGGTITGATITDNSITDCNGPGIILLGTLTDSAIADNIIDLTGVGGSTSDGVNVASTAVARVGITGNTIKGASRSGIHGLVATSDISIDGNRITNCQDGLKAVAAQTRWTVVGNTISNSVDRGLIFAVASTDIAVASNSIHNNPGGNYYTVGSTFLTHVINGGTGTYSSSAPPTGVGPNILGYDATRGVYNLKESHLRRSRAAQGKARGGSGYFNIAILSDSTGAGTGATNVATKSWPAQMEAMLVASGVPSSGSGMVPWWKNSTPADTRLTIGAGWAQLQGDTNLVANSTTTNALTFVSTNTGTIVRVLYYALSAAFTVAIDGGAPVTVTPSGTDVPAVYSVTGLANTTHTVAVARPSGSSVFQHAVEVANGTSGIRIYNASVGGNTIQYLANIAGAIGFGFPQIASATAGFNADLIIIDAEINDAVAALSTATFKTRWQSAITLAAANGADVVIKTSTPGSGLTLTGYTQQLYDLADANDIPLIDVQPRWGSYATANALGLMADTYHPSDAGYSDEALAVVRALGLVP